MSNYNISQIAHHVKNLLDDMREEDDEKVFLLLSDEDHGSFTWEYLPEPNIIALNPDWALLKMLKMVIKKALQDNGTIDLYYCPDNRIVTFEKYTDQQREESPTGYAQANNFFIHKD